MDKTQSGFRRNYHPLACALVAKGLIWEDNGDYVGKAADGQEVAIGVVGYEDNVEEYLKDHPTPESW